MEEKHATLTYTHSELVDIILMPVEFFRCCDKILSALWDTGAMISVMTPDVVLKLGPDIVGTIQFANCIHSFPKWGYYQGCLGCDL